MNTNTTATTSNKMFSFALNSTPLPKFVERGGREWISAGNNNKWFTELVDLAASSPTHGGIVHSLSAQIFGKGIRIKDNQTDTKLEAFMKSCNRNGEALEDVLQKVVMNYVLFGGFAFTNIWNKGQSNFEMYYSDLTCLRSGSIDITGQVPSYYFSSNWVGANGFKIVDGNNATEPKGQAKTIYKYPSFNTNEKVGTQIYYAKPHSLPGYLYYPLPLYMAAIPVAEALAKVWTYYNEELDSGFFGHVYFNFCNGLPSPEREEEIAVEMDNMYKGEKGRRILYGFSNGKETGVEITTLSSNDADKKFLDIANYGTQTLLSGWRIPSGELLAVQQISKLGSGNLYEAQQMMNALLIEPMAKTIMKEVNWLLKQNGFTKEMEFIPSNPISFSIPESLMSKTMYIDEIREMAGMEPLPNDEGQKLIDNASANSKVQPDNGQAPEQLLN